MWGKWLFLIGAFGTVFSSLLGVSQSAPYPFADCWRLSRARVEPGKFRNRPATAVKLVAALLLFSWLGARSIKHRTTQR